MEILFYCAFLAAYITGIFTSFAHGNFLFAIAEFFIFPLGVLHGIYCWFV